MRTRLAARVRRRFCIFYQYSNYSTTLPRTVHKLALHVSSLPSSPGRQKNLVDSPSPSAADAYDGIELQTLVDHRDTGNIVAGAEAGVANGDSREEG